MAQICRCALVVGVLFQSFALRSHTGPCKDCSDPACAEDPCKESGDTEYYSFDSSFDAAPARNSSEIINVGTLPKGVHVEGDRIYVATPAGEAIPGEDKSIETAANDLASQIKELAERLSRDDHQPIDEPELSKKELQRLREELASARTRQREAEEALAVQRQDADAHVARLRAAQHRASADRADAGTQTDAQEEGPQPQDMQMEAEALYQPVVPNMPLQQVPEQVRWKTKLISLCALAMAGAIATSDGCKETVQGVVCADGAPRPVFANLPYEVSAYCSRPTRAEEKAQLEAAVAELQRKADQNAALEAQLAETEAKSKADREALSAELQRQAEAAQAAKAKEEPQATKKFGKRWPQ